MDLRKTLKPGVEYFQKKGVITVLDRQALSPRNLFNRDYYNRVSLFLDLAEDRIVIPFFFRASPKRHYHAISNLVSHTRGKSVLEIACGSGNIIKSLGPDVSYTGLDISEKLLAKALKRIRRSNISDYLFFHADALDLPFNDKIFDLVVCNISLHFIQDYSRAIREISRVLKPGGVFVGSNPVIGISPGYDALWKKMSRKTLRWGTPFHEADLKRSCVSAGLSYEHTGANGSLIYFRAVK